MEDIIHLLPDSVANKIAAGEVIQQMSSVIKELVENSVDAGATRIEINIKDAGRTLIQVIDNGKGMSPTDARLAFERHSTSKIREADDLFSLTTMGFRGEALASIAAVSQLDVRTMPHDASIGTRLIINGSQVESQTPEATAPGTNFMVKNIFYNVPARRKFLKKDAVEFSNILKEFERLALVNPNIELVLHHNDKLIHSLTRTNLKTRIGELFGRNVEDNLVSLNSVTSIVKISGFIGNPSSARRRGALQYFFVNGRNMKHPYFRKAVLNCYEKLIPHDAQPNYFINFEVDPQSIDVNIHPTKSEIKFENEQAIWQLIEASVKESLGRFNMGPSIDFENLSPIEIKPFEPRPNDISPDSRILNSFNNRTVKGNYNPFKNFMQHEHDNSAGQSKTSAIDRWEVLYDTQQEPEGTRLIKFENPTQVSAKYLQLFSKYILLSARNELLIVDQHRAHIRILYDQIMSGLANGNMYSQQLLFTQFLDVNAAETLLLENILEYLHEFGFRLSHVNDQQWEITGVPSLLAKGDCSEILHDILSRVMNLSEHPDDSIAHIRSMVALSMARANAVTTGETLTEEEMEHIISSLFSLTSPKYTPDGKTIIAEISGSTIENLF